MYPLCSNSDIIPTAQLKFRRPHVPEESPLYAAPSVGLCLTSPTLAIYSYCAATAIHSYCAGADARRPHVPKESPLNAAPSVGLCLTSPTLAIQSYCAAKAIHSYCATEVSATTRPERKPAQRGTRRRTLPDIPYTDDLLLLYSNSDTSLLCRSGCSATTRSGRKPALSGTQRRTLPEISDTDDSFLLYSNSVTFLLCSVAIHSYCTATAMHTFYCAVQRFIPVQQLRYIPTVQAVQRFIPTVQQRRYIPTVQCSDLFLLYVPYARPTWHQV